MDIEGLKQAACARVDELADELIHASHEIHAHPELNFEEHFAHGVLTDMLERHGLAPTRHAYGLETAFDAQAGSAGPSIAVLCEYDALPGLGHAWVLASQLRPLPSRPVGVCASWAHPLKKAVAARFAWRAQVPSAALTQR